MHECYAQIYSVDYILWQFNILLVLSYQVCIDTPLIQHSHLNFRYLIASCTCNELELFSSYMSKLSLRAVWSQCEQVEPEHYLDKTNYRYLGVTG